MRWSVVLNVTKAVRDALARARQSNLSIPGAKNPGENLNLQSQQDERNTILQIHACLGRFLLVSISRLYATRSASVN